MQNIAMQLDIPEDILLALNESGDEFISQMKLYTAMQLYKEHKLSLGKASELSGLSRENFVETLAEHDIPLINYEIEDLVKEAEHLCQK